ncbi:MAG: tetratricopeptide repeat protein [Pseudoruegeria sp.]
MRNRRKLTVDQKTIVLISGFALLTACQLTGGDAVLTPIENPNPDPTVATFEDGVDGLSTGHALMDKGDYELALKAYYRAAVETGITTDFLTAAGSANLKLGRLGQAEELLRRAVKEDPTFAPAWNNLGVTLMEIGEYGEAKEVFRRAFALDSGESSSIRENFKISTEKLDSRGYGSPNNNDFTLVRRGSNEYLILGSPEATEQ